MAIFFLDPDFAQEHSGYVHANKHVETLGGGLFSGVMAAYWCITSGVDDAIQHIANGHRRGWDAFGGWTGAARARKPLRPVAPNGQSCP